MTYFTDSQLYEMEHANNTIITKEYINSIAKNNKFEIIQKSDKQVFLSDVPNNKCNQSLNSPE
jgi:hypothetical protein